MPLPAYRVHLDNGTSYVTGMARGVTLAQARSYFTGLQFEQPDETTFLTVVAVESVDSEPDLDALLTPRVLDRILADIAALPDEREDGERWDGQS